MFVHPTHRQPCAKHAGIRLDNQDIRLPARQPGYETNLPADIIGRTGAHGLDIARRKGSGDFQAVRGIDRLVGARPACEHAQATLAYLGEHIEKCRTVGREHTLLYS